MIKYLVLISLIAVSGCAAGQLKDPFPPENIIMMCPYLNAPMLLEKGFFDDPNNWVTEREFNRLGFEETNIRTEE